MCVQEERERRKQEKKEKEKKKEEKKEKKKDKKSSSVRGMPALHSSISARITPHSAVNAPNGAFA